MKAGGDKGQAERDGWVTLLLQGFGIALKAEVSFKTMSPFKSAVFRSSSSYLILLKSFVHFAASGLSNAFLL